MSRLNALVADPDCDGNYENEVRFALHHGARVVVKRYRRSSRFWSEVNGLMIAGPAVPTPRLLEVRPEALEVTLSRTDGTPLHNILDMPRAHHVDWPEKLARCLQRLHACAAPAYGTLDYPSAQGYPTWLAYLEARFAERMAQVRLSDADRKRLVNWFTDHLGLVDTTCACLLHNDLKPSNILVADDGTYVLIDFDRSAGGDPLSDLGKLFWRTFGHKESPEWARFQQTYFGRTPTAKVSQLIRFYASLHCLGAVAYFHSFRVDRYARIAAEAADLLHSAAGVRCL